MAENAKIGIKMIRNATILSGATISATGGTASTLKTTGLQVPSGVQVSDSSIADIRLRPTITFKGKPAAVQRDGSWSKQKSEWTVRMPKILADGTTTINFASGTISVHPESTDVEIVKLIAWNCQILFDADFTDFVKSAVTD